VEPEIPPASHAGPVDSVRALGATLMEIVAARAELAMVELREQGERRKEIVLLAALAGVLFALALLLATLFVLALFWDTHRLAAIAGVALLYFAIAAAAFGRMRVKIALAPSPFEATLREFAADRDLLTGRHE
jgi:uncharacterized membrane protein YqjE